MERTDAIFILKALRVYDGRPALSETVRTNVNVARDEALSREEFAATIAQLKDSGLVDDVADPLSRERRLFITAAGRAVLKEAGL